MNTIRYAQQARASVGVFLRDVGNGLLEVSHNTFALVGLAVVAALIFVVGRSELRMKVEDMAMDWLRDRYEARAEVDGNLLGALRDPQAVKRATALDPTQLSKQQAQVAHWLSKRYRVGIEPISRLVHEAWTIAPLARLEPTLILATVAIESGFNPFAQSPMGAQGLMQVMTQIHDEKYRAFGGRHAAFDPVSNLKVGVQVLKDCVSRFGGVDGGLRCYVGAANQEDDSGYAAKVMSEYRYMQLVLEGKAVPFNVSGPAPRPSLDGAKVALLR